LFSTDVSLNDEETPFLMCILYIVHYLQCFVACKGAA